VARPPDALRALRKPPRPQWRSSRTVIQAVQRAYRSPVQIAVVVTVVVAAVLATNARAAGAASDPLEEAKGRITTAQEAADEATAEFEQAQTRSYELQDAVEQTTRQTADTRARMRTLTTIVRSRAVAAYKGGLNAPFEEFLGDTSNALEAGRRAHLLDKANAESHSALNDFRATSDDLRVQEASLRDQLATQRQAVNELRDRQIELERSLANAIQEERSLRAELERQRRADEYAALVRQAKAAARATAIARAEAVQARPAPVESQPAVSADDPPASTQPPPSFPPPAAGGMVCPVAGAVSFTDTYGSPRSGGRSHKGVDMFAARGTPTVAVLSGSVFFQSDPLGGLAAYLQASDGNTYYYAHLNDYVGGARSVSGGEVIGHVGTTGTVDAPPHLHFERRLGGANGERVNPYPTVRPIC
jgi:murein DD-endopeptidase MepM/ murein hydrolase activator NlpD